MQCVAIIAGVAAINARVAINAIQKNKIQNSRQGQACLRQTPTANGPQRDYHVGHETPAGKPDQALEGREGPACLQPYQAHPGASTRDFLIWFGCRVLRRAEEKRRLGQQQQKAEKSATTAAGAPDKGLPAFEKHSKGIGSKLMAMMG